MTVAELPVTPETLPAPEPAAEGETRQQGLAMICYSGDLEKTWAAMILASTAGAMGMPTKVFVTFWGLQTFVKPGQADHGRELDAEDDVHDVAARHRASQAVQDELPGHGPVDDAQAREAVQRVLAGRAARDGPGAGRRVHPVPDDHGHVRHQARGPHRRAWASPSGAATYLGYVADGASPIFI